MVKVVIHSFDSDAYPNLEQVRINETNLKTQVKQLMEGLQAATSKLEQLERERVAAKREQQALEESKSKGIL